MELIQNSLSEVPEELKEPFKVIQDSLPEMRAFLEHKDWRLYAKTEDNKVKTMISDRNIFCVKSTSIVQGSITEIFNMIMDLQLKPKFDDTLEYGNRLQEMPLETYFEYNRFRRILIISPRDMVFVSKVFRVSTS